MLTMVEPYMILEEKLTTHFENPVSIESHSNHPTGNNLADVRMTLIEYCWESTTDIPPKGLMWEDLSRLCDYWISKSKNPTLIPR